MNDNSVLRLCAAVGPLEYGRLPREMCTCPERCVDRKCTCCGATVHYDPRARIPALGTEVIVCGGCFEAIGQGVEPYPEPST